MEGYHCSPTMRRQLSGSYNEQQSSLRIVVPQFLASQADTPGSGRRSLEYIAAITVAGTAGSTSVLDSDRRSHRSCSCTTWSTCVLLAIRALDYHSRSRRTSMHNHTTARRVTITCQTVPYTRSVSLDGSVHSNSRRRHPHNVSDASNSAADDSFPQFPLWITYVSFSCLLEQQLTAQTNETKNLKSHARTV